MIYQRIIEFDDGFIDRYLLYCLKHLGFNWSETFANRFWFCLIFYIWMVSKRFYFFIVPFIKYFSNQINFKIFNVQLFMKISKSFVFARKSACFSRMAKPILKIQKLFDVTRWGLLLTSFAQLVKIDTIFVVAEKCKFCAWLF